MRSGGLDDLQGAQATFTFGRECEHCFGDYRIIWDIQDGALCVLVIGDRQPQRNLSLSACPLASHRKQTFNGERRPIGDARDPRKRTLPAESERPDAGPVTARLGASCARRQAWCRSNDERPW